MPVGVIGANFSQEYNCVLSEQKKREEIRCKRKKEIALGKKRMAEAGVQPGHEASGDEEEDDALLTADLQRLQLLLDKAVNLEDELSTLLSEPTAQKVYADPRVFLMELLHTRDG